MSILDTILEHKRAVEVPQRKREHPLADVKAAAEKSPIPRNFAAALKPAHGNVALIAEVKRASPSKGDLVKGRFDPVAIAKTYEANGAAAISVLTDEPFFRGALSYLSDVKRAVGIPVLRKDFVVDEYQIYEARAAGADAVLLIVAALSDAELRDLCALASELRLAALVEVHDEAETERALALGASVIGVNNRDLRTFVTDMETTARCARLLPIGHTLVSESGIFTPADVQRVAAMGASAILVGESLITSADMAAQVRALSAVTR
ncbi:MAG: indole-3-glycerol phosphate synthase TrpC [Anaerolineae bacterium]